MSTVGCPCNPLLSTFIQNHVTVDAVQSTPTVGNEAANNEGENQRASKCTAAKRFASYLIYAVHAKKYAADSLRLPPNPEVFEAQL